MRIKKELVLQRLVSSRGDTIVEVLISMAIISLTLAGAYAAVRSNTHLNEKTQEGSQALQIVQRQIELLRTASPLPTDGCFSSGGTVTSDTDRNCYFSYAGTDNCPAASAYCYHVQISVSGGNVYQVQAKWTGATNTTDEQSKVTLYYKPYAGA